MDDEDARQDLRRLCPAPCVTLRPTRGSKITLPACAKLIRPKPSLLSSHHTSNTFTHTTICKHGTQVYQQPIWCYDQAAAACARQIPRAVRACNCLKQAHTTTCTRFRSVPRPPCACCYSLNQRRGVTAKSGVLLKRPLSTTLHSWSHSLSVLQTHSHTPSSINSHTVGQQQQQRWQQCRQQAPERAGSSSSAAGRAQCASRQRSSKARAALWRGGWPLQRPCDKAAAGGSKGRLCSSRGVNVKRGGVFVCVMEVLKQSGFAESCGCVLCD